MSFEDDGSQFQVRLVGQLDYVRSCSVLGLFYGLFGYFGVGLSLGRHFGGAVAF